MTERRNPETIHPPVGPYAHQVEADGRARWLVMAGQVGRTPDGHVPDDPIEQISVALQNVKRNLEAGGMDIGDLVKWTWYLVGDVDARRRREATLAWLGGHQPASTLVYVAALAAPEYRVEIDALACRE
jgi:2-iminobutanoate/2-iminopropanoate deaminase